MLYVPILTYHDHEWGVDDERKNQFLDTAIEMSFLR